MSMSWQNPSSGHAIELNDGIPLSTATGDQLPSALADNMNDVSCGTPTKRHNPVSPSKTTNLTMSSKKLKQKEKQKKEETGLGKKFPMQAKAARKKVGQPLTPWRAFVASHFAQMPSGSFKSKMEALSKLWKAKQGVTETFEDANATESGEMSTATSVNEQ